MSTYGSVSIVNNTRPGALAFYDGDNVTVTATPNEGYTFENFTLGVGGTVLNATTTTPTITYTFTVSEDANIVANFVTPQTYTVRIRRTGGSCDVSPAIGEHAGLLGGSTLHLSAAASCGSVVFQSWKEGATELSSDPEYDYVVTGNVTIDAVYTTSTTTITLVADPTQGGSFTVGGVATTGGSYATGSTQTIVAVPAADYRFDKWLDDNTLAASRSYTVPATDATLTASFVRTYNATANAGEGGSASVSPATADENGTFTFTATANDCYNFVQWSDGSTDATHTVTADADKNLTATFAINSYTVTTGSYTGGTVTAPATTVNCGENITVTATAADHYHFVQWSDGNTDRVRTYNNVRANINNTPVFAKDTYTVTATATNGTVNGSANVSVEAEYGDPVTLTASPADNYSFSGWSGDATGNTNPLTVTVDGNKTIVANFTYVNQTFAITREVSPEGAIAAGCSISGPESYTESNPAVSYTATPAGNYQFSHWMVNGVNAGTTNPLSITPTGATTVQAVFNYVAPTYTITKTVDPAEAAAAGCTIEGPESYTEGSAAAVYTYHAEDYYQFTRWEVDGVNQGNAASLSITPSANTTVKGVFTYNRPSYTITTAVSPAAAGTVTGGGSYLVNETATLEVSANNGYTFDHWQDGGNANPRTVTVTDNATYTAVFTANSYSVNVTSNNNTYGTATASANSATYGNSVTLEATPASDCYYFVRWSDNNTQNPRTVSVTENVSLQAIFDVYNYTVTASGTNGTVTVTPATVVCGGNVTLNATANNGYHFAYWDDDHTLTNNQRTVTGITSNRTFVAVFEADASQWAVNIDVNPLNSGYITGVANGNFENGSVINPIANANANYVFVDWSDGETNPTHPAITVNGPVNLTANFNYVPPASVTINATGEPAAIASNIHITGTGTYDLNTVVTLAATCTDPTYQFKYWTENGTPVYPNAIFGFRATADRDLVAVFELVTSTSDEDYLVYRDSLAGRTIVIGCSNPYLTTIEVPNRVRKIDTGAFRNMTSLVSINIPSNVDTIGPEAFRGCTSLEEINLPSSVRYLGKYAFYNCTSLQNLTINASLDTIYERTFTNCYRLRRIELPATVKEIGKYAFYNCDDVYTLTIPASVDTVRENAFGSIESLRFVNIEGGNHYFENYAFVSPNSIAMTNFNGTVAEWLTNRFANQYANPMNYSANFAINGVIVTDLEVPGTVDTVFNYAFYNGDQFRSITIGAGVDSIAPYAFAELGNLEDIVLEGVAPRLGNNAFYHVSNQVTVTVPCSELDSIRRNGWGQFVNFQADQVPTIRLLHANGGFAKVNVEPNCTSLNTQLVAIPGYYYEFTGWSNGATENPYDFVITNDLTIAPIFQRRSDIDSLDSKTITFETNEDFASWYGEKVDGNAWYVGTATKKNGQKSLYVSNDDGVNNDYNNSSSYYGSTASTNADFLLKKGVYNFRFYWHGNGDVNDYLTASLVSENGNITIPVTENNLYNEDDWSYFTRNVTVQNPGWYSLRFNWRVNRYTTYNPAGAVDQIQIQYQEPEYLENLSVYLVARADDPTMGTVTGGGWYYYVDNATITAVPNDGYHFTHWNDGSTQNPRTVAVSTVSGTGLEYVAYFEEAPHTVTLAVTPSGTATVRTSDGRSEYVNGSTVTISADNWQCGWSFLGWSTDATEANIFSTEATYSFTINEDVNYTAIMKRTFDTVWIIRIVNAPGDTTTNVYYENPFQNGNSPSPNTVFNTFDGGNIQVVDMLDPRIYGSMGQIVVEDAGGQMVTIYDVNGRQLSRKQDTTGKLYFDVPVTGTYLVQIGNLITRKVVVMK